MELGELQDEVLRLAGAQHFELDLGAGRASERLIDPPQRQLARRLAVETRDDVALLEAERRGRPFLLHRDHVGDAALLGDAQAAPALTHLARGQVVRDRVLGDVHRERVERVGRSVERAVHQMIEVGLVDVGLPHQPQDLGEDGQIFIERVFAFAVASRRAEQGSRQDGEDEDAGDQEEEEAASVHRGRSSEFAP